MAKETQTKDQQELIEHLSLDFMQMREFARHPLIIDRADGIHVTDVNGRTYIDGISGVMVVATGHNNRAVIDAMVAQLQSLSFAPPLHGTNPRALELAALLRQIAPPGLGSVKFVSGGSEAIEAAVKLARQYHSQTGHPRKYKFISRYGAFHGSTMAALSAGGGADRKSIFEPLGVGFVHTHPPDCYHCPFDKVYPSCGITCAKLVERTIQAEDPETVAAVIMEPVSLNPSAGFVVPPREFFAIVREACNRHNVLLIMDEIITGFGRMGAMFGADHYGVVPDIICCAKGISSGYAPLGAILFADRIQEAFLGEPDQVRGFYHGHTYGGNPVSCAAGVANIQQILDRRLVENAQMMGRYLREKLEAMRDRYPIVANVRGVGLLLAVELLKDRQTKERFAGTQPAKLVERAARERGLILRCYNEFIVFTPPLIVTERDIDDISSITEQSIAAVQEQLLG